MRVVNSKGDPILGGCASSASSAFSASGTTRRDPFVFP